MTEEDMQTESSASAEPQKKKRGPGRPKGTTKKKKTTKPKRPRGRPRKPKPPEPAKESETLIDELPTNPADLAKAILKEREEEKAEAKTSNESKDAPEPAPEPEPVSVPAPKVPVPPISKPTGFQTEPQAAINATPDKPKRKKLPAGDSPGNPVQILRHETQIFDWLAYHFGSGPKSYFIHSDQVFNKRIGNRAQRMKIIVLEDKNGYKYQIWFDITALSLLR